MKLIIFLVSLFTVSFAVLVPGPWSDKQASPEDRAHALVANLTQDEKLSMLHGCHTPPRCGAYTGE